MKKKRMPACQLLLNLVQEQIWTALQIRMQSERMEIPAWHLVSFTINCSRFQWWLVLFCRTMPMRCASIGCSNTYATVKALPHFSRSIKIWKLMAIAERQKKWEPCVLYCVQETILCVLISFIMHVHTVKHQHLKITSGTWPWWTILRRAHNLPASIGRAGGGRHHF